MPQDRDAARRRIANAGLAQTALERVSRTSFGRMPITLVDRARAQLRRFFSEGPWTVEDDAGLSGLVGPGEGWTDEDLAPGTHGHRLVLSRRARVSETALAWPSKPS